jgi:hypothetical protein
MTAAQRDLLRKAQESLDAARLLHREGFHAFAASRAYYAMFYAEQSLVPGERLIGPLLSTESDGGDAAEGETKDQGVGEPYQVPPGPLQPHAQDDSSAEPRLCHAS